MLELKSFRLTRYSFLKILVKFKIFVMTLACLSPFVHPHIIRQSDTMGVALRYWMRWTQELQIKFPLLPAVLNAGDKYGISAMEFPIFNLITAPFFSLGLWWGRIFASLFMILLSLWLVFLHTKAWKAIKIYGIEVEKISWLFLIFGISQAYIGRFMPDFIAFILVSISIGISWKKPQLRKSLLLASLGMLIKPPVIIAFALILIRPIKIILKNYAPYVFLSVVIVLSYYTWGMDKIREVSDMTEYFAVRLRNPFLSLSSFLLEPKSILNLFLKNIFPSFTILIILPFILTKKHRATTYPLLGILLIQTILGAALDGTHIFIHNYYYIGTSFVTCFFLLYFIQHAPRKLIVLLCSILTFYHIERGFYETRQVFANNIWKQCQNILNNSFEGNSLKISTPKRRYSFEGLCMGKIQNSQDQENYIEIKKNKVIHHIKN